MTTKDYCSINFTGLTHDHSLECRAAEEAANGGEAPVEGEAGEPANFCSAIPILKQHPMYDCLVLVRKYRHCLGGYSLEFPVDRVREHERLPTNESAHHHNADGAIDEQQQLDSQSLGLTEQQPARRLMSSCSQRRLVSRFLDGDDPMYRCAGVCGGGSLTSSLSQNSMGGGGGGGGHLSDGGSGCEAESPTAPLQNTLQTDETDARLLFMSQVDDRGHQCHLVHVPINGLLDRLESYTRNGVAVDSRVYAFAMGLKTAERMMTTKSMKELHETPI